MNFKEIGVSYELAERLSAMGISSPTPIQESVIPMILSSQSIMAISQTGSGKTLAYLLPLVQKIITLKSTKTAQAIILVPTRELAIQANGICEIICKGSPICSVAIYGGVTYDSQIELLQTNPQIIVATPGRLIDLVEQNVIIVDSVDFIVLDEVDQMLDLGFIEPIKRILEYKSSNAQIYCFSATTNPEISEIFNSLNLDIKQVTLENQKIAVEKIEQSAYYVTIEMMDQLLIHLIRKENPKSCIVFTRSRKMADRLTSLLKENNFSAEALHSDKSQAAREYILDRFRNAETTILVSTDIMARGIDVDNIDIVFNYGLPLSAELYIHRIGRTARAGQAGKSISLCTPSEEPMLTAVQKMMKQKIDIVANHPYHTSEVTKSLSNIFTNKTSKKKTKRR